MKMLPFTFLILFKINFNNKVDLSLFRLGQKSGFLFFFFFLMDKVLIQKRVLVCKGMFIFTGFAWSFNFRRRSMVSLTCHQMDPSAHYLKFLRKFSIKHLENERYRYPGKDIPMLKFWEKVQSSQNISIFLMPFYF